MKIMIQNDLQRRENEMSYFTFTINTTCPLQFHHPNSSSASMQAVWGTATKSSICWPTCCRNTTTLGTRCGLSTWKYPPPLPLYSREYQGGIFKSDLAFFWDQIETKRRIHSEILKPTGTIREFLDQLHRSREPWNYASRYTSRLLALSILSKWPMNTAEGVRVLAVFPRKLGSFIAVFYKNL